jgi:hypothetical protein
VEGGGVSNGGIDKRSPINPLEWVAVANERRPNKPGLTVWFSGNEAPPMSGWYERHFTDSMIIGDSTMQWWDGKYWRSSPNAQPHWRQRFDYPAWRGMVPIDPQATIT